MNGAIVCLDNVDFTLCLSVIIKEKEMAYVETSSKVSSSLKEQQIFLLIFPILGVSVKLFVSR